MASKWLPGYQWAADSGRYRGPSGRYVKRDTILDLLETSISQRARDIRKGYEAVLNQELGIHPWQHRTAQELKREHLELAALAAGGWDRLTPPDYVRIDGRLAFDLKHLAVMAQEISEDKVSLAQGLNRLDMYLGSARREYLDVEKDRRIGRVKDGYALIAKRHLAPHAVHCQDCEDMSLWPWRPADVVPVPTEACQCGMNCKCSIEYKETPMVYMEVAEFNPHHDALGRFATGPGMHAPDTGGGGGGEPPQRGALDTAEGLQRSITSGVKADRELGGLGDTHAFEVHFIDYNDGSRGVLKPAELTEVYDTAVGETLAYEVDQAIGLGMVPATVMVEYAGKPASLQRFVPDARTAREHGWEYEQQGHRAVMAAFDSVIQNPDRNSGNFMIRGDHSLVLIDHGLCLDSGYGHPDSGYGYNPRDAAKILHESVKGLGDYGEPVRAFVGKIRDLDMKQAATRVSARNPKLPKEAVDSVFVRLRELRDAYVEIERGGA